MKGAARIVVVGLLVIPYCQVHAASLSYTQTNDAFAVYLDGEEHNDQFETIFFQAKPNPPSVFTNVSSGIPPGVPRPPGHPFTYPNRMLNADPLDFPEGLGLSQIGLINNGQELSFTVANLFGTITTAPQPNGDLILGNVNMPGAGASANVLVQLLRAGNLVQELRMTIPIPEPSGAVLGAAGFAALSLARSTVRQSPWNT